MKIIFAIIAVIFLVGCGVKKPTEASGTITKEQASSLVSGINGKDMAFKNPTGVISNSVRGKAEGFGFSRMATTSACNPTKSGNETDSDKDSVPADLTYTVSCSDVEAGEGKLSISAVAKVSDKDDSKKFPLGGVRVAMDGAKVSYTGGGQTLEAGLDFLYDLAQSSNIFTLVFEFVADGRYQDKSAVLGIWIDQTVVVDSESAPEDSGKTTFNGFVKVEKVLDTTVTLKVSATDITYSKSCSNFFKNGVIALEDGSGNKATFNYSNCTQTRKYNSESL